LGLGADRAGRGAIIASQAIEGGTSNAMSKPQDFWSGPTGFILATIGAAVGLGSIWKFPYEVGANGGGAFILFYLIGLVLIVFPLMLVEFAIGRRGRSNAADAMANVAQEVGASRLWALIGLFGIITAFLILSFYSVIGGWAIAYAVETASYGLAGLNAASAQARFDALMASPARMAAYHLVYMAAVASIVARGVARGIEDACKILMPVLILLIIGLSVFSLMLGDVKSTIRFLFQVDPRHLTLAAALDALGLGFFSIGVGLALMITYAAYAGADINLRKVAIVTIAGDTAVSLAAGLAIFPIVFAEGLDPASGPGLMFVTLPLAFARIPGGDVAAFGFFLLLVIAAIASGISMLEMAVALLSRRGWSRAKASLATAAACWGCGLATVLSFNVWANWHPLSAMPAFAGATVFVLLDHFTSNIMLPLGGFALALFAGWVLPAKLLLAELGLKPGTARLLQLLLRTLVPVCIAVVTIFPLFAAKV
jgi:neurotransmitter:Na+ symporter, NSS family